MIKYVKGDLLDSHCDYICHQVNCRGVMGSGIAKQIRERFPEVYDSYKELCNEFEPEVLLGTIDIVEVEEGAREIVNIFGQLDYGRDGKKYTSYDAFANALDLIDAYVPEDWSIGFPKYIGCGLGGGNWNIIVNMIEEILDSHVSRDIYIYELEG